MTVVWLTGLPAVGKTTVAEKLRDLLVGETSCVMVLDSDELRDWLTPDPTNSEAEEDAFYRSVGRFAASASGSGAMVIVAAVAPKRSYRDAVRERVAKFTEVYLFAEPSVLEARIAEAGGAASGSGSLLSGSAYEPPKVAELTFDSGRRDADYIAETVFEALCPPKSVDTKPAPARPIKVPTTIVAGTDFSPLAEVATKTAFNLARRMKSSRVHLVHVQNRVTSIAYAFPDMEAVEESTYLRTIEHLEGIGEPGINITREVRRGIPSRDLAAAAVDVDADLIVVATSGYGAIRRAILGSVAAALIRVSEIPVLIVRGTEPAGAFDHVLAAVDLSPISQRIVDAAKLHSRVGDVKVVCAVEKPLVVSRDYPMSSREVLADDQRAREASMKSLRALHEDVAVLDGPASTAILQAAEDENADLIVIGTSGHSAWHRMFVGSTATRVLANATRPVLVIPNQDVS